MTITPVKVSFRRYLPVRSVVRALQLTDADFAPPQSTGGKDSDAASLSSAMAASSTAGTVGDGSRTSSTSTSTSTSSSGGGGGGSGGGGGGPFGGGSGPSSADSPAPRMDRLSDTLRHLCAHPGYRFLTTRLVPMVPSASIDFASDSWSALLKRLHQAHISDVRSR